MVNQGLDEGWAGFLTSEPKKMSQAGFRGGPGHNSGCLRLAANEKLASYLYGPVQKHVDLKPIIEEDWAVRPSRTGSVPS